MANHNFNDFDRLTLGEALPIFYKQYRLQADGGIDDPAAKVELLKGWSIYIPNITARKKLILKHDCHHLLTGYSATMRGETEISTWELSTGCSHQWFAFLINTYGMMIGLPFQKRNVWRAWLKGRSSRNLYRDDYQIKDLLARKVSELREELGLSKQGNPGSGLRDHLSFLGIVGLGTVVSLLSFGLIPILLVFSVYTWMKQACKTH